MAEDSARPPVPQARVWRLLQGEVLRTIVALHLRVFGGREGEGGGEEMVEGFLTAYDAGNLILKCEISGNCTSDSCTPERDVLTLNLS